MARIDEHYVTLWGDDARKAERLPEVQGIIERSYAKIGGPSQLNGDYSALLSPKYMWKLCTREGKVTACVIYKAAGGGRKISLAASDGTERGKADLYSILREDAKQLDRRAWGEFSGAIEHIATDPKYGIEFPIIGQRQAKEVLKYLGKDVDSLDPDGMHYVRRIHGSEHRKAMMGNLPDELASVSGAAGMDPKEALEALRRHGS